MAGDCAVGSFGLDCLSVRRQKHGGHQPERSESLRDNVGLDVTIIVFAGPDIAARPFERRCDHVVDQAVFVGDPDGVEPGFEFVLEYLLEQVFEAAIIGLQDRVFGREIDRIFPVQAVIERGTGKITDRIVKIIHG